MNIINILESGGVTRFHNVVGVDKQPNSEHQWEVALLLQHIYPDCSKKLLLAALTHDAAEYYTGDIPFLTKRRSPELKSILTEMEKEWETENGVHFKLSEEEEFFLKIADILSGMFYCLSQVIRGNVNAKFPFQKWRSLGKTMLSARIDADVQKNLDIRKYGDALNLLERFELDMRLK